MQEKELMTQFAQLNSNHFSYFACSIDWEIGRTRESMDDTRPDPEEGWPL